MTIEGFRGKEVAAAKNNYGSLIQIDFSIGLHFEEIYSGISLIGAQLAVIFRARFAADPWALMSTRKRSGAALVAWEAAAGCSTRHATIPLVLA
jgi:hypothetical protein